LSNFTVQIDATRLFYREFLVQPTSLGWIDASTVQSIALAAGTYSIQVQSGVYTDFSFTVTAQGTIDFSTAFDGFAAGRGSALLALAGLEVTLDASELAHGSGGGVLFASIPYGSDPWMLVRTLRLLPQQHYMVQQGSGVVCNLEFALGTDGRFAYAPALDVAQGGCLAGAGTPALRFHGLPVLVDVSAVSALLGLPDIFGLEAVRTGVQVLRVLPAEFFRVQIDQGITGSLFSLDNHGGVTLAASPDGMRLALDAPAGVPRVRALPLALPAPGPLSYVSDDFGSFLIVVGSDATGAQSVSMVMSGGRVAWLVDRRWFPGQATLTVQRRNLGPRRSFVLSVTFAAARFPGTDVPADFALTVSRVNTPDGVEIDVELGWSFGNGHFSSDAGFDGTASAMLPVAGRVCGFGADQHLDLVATAPVDLRFRPGWLSLAAPKLAELAGPAGALGMASLELALLAPTDRVLFAADVAPPLCSRITFTATTPWQVALPTLYTPVGELGAVADLFDSALAEVGENLDGRRRQALRFASSSNATAFTLTLGGGLVDAAGRPIMVALAGCVCKFVFDSVPPRAELHAQASTASMWLPVCGIGIRLGARLLEPLVSNFGMAFDGSVLTLLACDLPYSAVAAAPADAVAEAAAVRGLLSIVPAAARPDAATQRNWLHLGASVGEAAVSLRDVALAVLRSADLLALRIDATDMALVAAPGLPARLVPALAGRDGTLIAGFAPQHLVEPSFHDAFAPPPVGSRQAELSRLAFAIPAGHAGIALDATLFDWSAFAPRLNQPLTDGPPSAQQTVVEMPYRLWLSPAPESGWTPMAPLPRTPAAPRVPLATTRLGLRRSGPRGPFVDERDNADTLAARRLRAVGSPDDVIGALPADPIANVVEANARRDLVEHTKIAADAQLIECRHLMLSALGGWLDAEGRWDVPPGTGLVAHWSQRIAMGRDERVEVTRQGWLLPWGHRAAKVSVARRSFGEGPLGAGQNTAYLGTTDFLVVTQHLRRYPSMRELPFVEAEIMIGQTPELSRNEAAHAIGPVAQNAPTPFWVWLHDPAGGADQPMRFPLHLRDLDTRDDPRGRVVTAAAMAIFVPDGVSDAQVAAAIDAYNSDPTSGWQDFAAAPQRIAFAPPQAGGHADLDTLGLQFAVVANGAGDALPRIAQARVRLADVQQLAKVPGDGAVDITYFAGYLAGDNAAGLFARVLPVKDAAGQLSAVPMNFSGPNASGLATPDMGITGLSQAIGPVGGDLNRLADAVPSFDPKDFFGQAVPKLFGGISLLDVLPPVHGPAALDAAPKLVTTRGGTQVETRYDWTPTVRSFDGPVSLVFDGLPADGQSIMQGPIRLHSSLKLRPSVDPESVVVATVGNFTIGFAGLVSVAVRELQLTQRSGRKPEVSFALAAGADNPLRLLDKIDFLQPLLDVAHTLLGAAPAVDLAGGVVKIGYAAALPALSIGVFSLENIRIGVGLAIPLGGDPVAFDFNFGEKDHHFLVTVAFIGGGGFFAIEVGADGPRSIELAVEVAASVALDLGVASGSAHVAVGVYLHFVPGDTVITGFVRAGGELTVLAVLSLHVELYLGLTYESTPARKVIFGEASLMVEVSIGCLSQSVTLSMRREFVVGGSETAALPQARAALLTPVPGVERAFGNSRDDWQAYFAAFA
jgi:hypothetical protein